MDDDRRRKDRREYQKYYYEQNKEDLSKQRKDRYKNDPEYREKVKAASKRYRAEQREKREKEKPKGAPVKRERRPRRPVVVKVNGSEVLAYTVPVLASRVGRSINTINRWIYTGTIPKTPLWSERGDRLYTDAMIRVVKMAIQFRGIVGDDPAVRDEILDGWKSIGISVKRRKVRAKQS